MNASGGLIALAASAAIEERSKAMRQSAAPGPAADGKAATRAAWALGDYHRFAKQTVWPLGPVLVEACGIRPGERVLDVAAGTGNAAIRAAEAGAGVVACDLTPEHFAAGRREAGERGVELEWVEGDAEALPFPDGAFDVVISSFGVIFAPDHRRAADELVRVCRPGGRIGLLSFTPEGLIGPFFAALAPYAPPPEPGAGGPPQWGSVDHLHGLFGDRVAWTALDRREYSEWAPSPERYADLLLETFGPIVAMAEALAQEPERLAAMRRDLHAFARAADAGRPGGPAEYRYEYLLAVGRRQVSALSSTNCSIERAGRPSSSLKVGSTVAD
jgi:ubiquinone/menaquinone biosynthesis C-methylase UbiE